MKKITALTTMNNTASIKIAIDGINKEYGNILNFKKIYFDDYEYPDVSLKPIVQDIDSSDIILIDIRGDMRIARELPKLLNNKDKTVVVLVAGTQQLFSLIKMGKFKGETIFKTDRDKNFTIDSYIRTKKYSEVAKKLAGLLPVGMIKDMRNWILAQEYYMEGNSENFKNLLLFLLKKYAGVKEIKKIAPPQKHPSYGLYIPQKGICEDIEEYKRGINYDPKKTTIGVLLYNGLHFDDTRPIADILYEYLITDVNIINVFSNVEENINAINRYLKDIDLFLNLQYFRIHGGPFGGDPDPVYRFFQKTDVPMMIGLRSFQTDLNSWKESSQGLSPIETTLGIVLPELDGGIEPIFVAALNSTEDPVIGKVKDIKIIDYNIEKLAQRIKKWLILRNKENQHKRIAIVTYNYPPGEDNLASAGYLDVFQSLHIFLEKLKSSGYVLDIPSNMKEFFLEHSIVNSPNYIQKSGIRVHKKKYISWFNSIPERIKMEVIKHWGEPPGDIMVDGDYIIIPGYILSNIFIGVQPSRGVHEDIDNSYHDKELPPHHQYLAYYFYLEKEFQMDAVIHFGMHGSLEFTRGKEVALSNECYPDILIGNSPNIYYYWVGNTSESTIAKRRSYALCISHASPPMRSSGLYEKYIVLEDFINQYESDKNQKTYEILMETAGELHLPDDYNELVKEIFRMKRRLIPYGMHVIDRKLQGEELISYLTAVCRIDREYPSLFKLLADKKEFDWENIKGTLLEENLESEVNIVIRDILNNNPSKWLPEGYTDYVQETKNRIDQSSESISILKALDGRYITPACGGDPVRSPEVYPSGRSMYAFDPRLIPTIASVIRGAKAASLLIDSYVTKYRKYPDSIGIVLWGFETMKTGGDTISLILSLLGVKIKHKKSPWFKELEVIPLEELKRPRIDVVITICGIFRDTFPSLIDLLNRAIEMIALLEEDLERNYVRKHYLNMKDKFMDSAYARIFGPSPGEYGTSMRTLVENSSWEEEDDLVQSYDDSMCYSYLKGKIERNEDAYSDLLKSVDLITQERDSTEYEVTDLDHYYEFLGGLSRSVQDKKGCNADVKIIDTTEDEVIVENLENSIERSARTRIMNPRWIDGMLKHDFHGAKNIKDRVECLLGFSATTGKVENWIFDNIADRLIFDDKMRRELQANNPYAALKICETLMESEHRGYWEVGEEKIKELRNIILSMESDVE